MRNSMGNENETTVISILCVVRINCGGSINRSSFIIIFCLIIKEKHIFSICRMKKLCLRLWQWFFSPVNINTTFKSTMQMLVWSGMPSVLTFRRWGISTDTANWRSYALLFQHVCLVVNEQRREEAAAWRRATWRWSTPRAAEHDSRSASSPRPRGGDGAVVKRPSANVSPGVISAPVGYTASAAPPAGAATVGWH